MQHHPRRVCSRSRRRSQSSGISDVVLLCLTCLVVRQAAGQEAREVPLPQAGPECVAVPGGTGSVVPPGRGQWGFLRLPLDPPLGPGLASLSLTYLADAQRSAAALIYAETPAGEHIPPYGLRLPSATDGQLHEASFTVSAPDGLQALIIKRADAGTLDTPPITGISVSLEPGRPDPRVPAYQALLARLALTGVSPNAPRRWLDEAADAGRHLDAGLSSERIKQTECWLAAHSQFAWLADSVAYLGHAARLLGARREQVDALRDTERQVARLLTRGEVDAAQGPLAQLEVGVMTESIRLARGPRLHILPDLQPVITTWVKNWGLAGFSSEPTPLSVRWQGGPAISFAESQERQDRAASGETLPLADAELAADCTVRRTWTGNVWDTPYHRLRVSVLSPLVLVEDIRGGLNPRLSGSGGLVVDAYDQATGRVLHPAADAGDTIDLAFGQCGVVRAADGLLLVLPTAPARIDVGGHALRVSCADGTGVALVGLPPLHGPDAADRLAEAVRVWSAIAACPPTECVQTYDGRELALSYVYAHRPCPPGIQPLRIAPVPPLARLAKDCGWGLGMPRTRTTHACWPTPGFQWLEGRELRLHVPPMAATLPSGANVWLDQATRETYRELADRGAGSVRLVIMDGPEYLAPPAPGFVSKLRTHLAWCREFGLKATVDLHNQGDTSTAALRSEQERAARAAIWRDVATVCLEYRDAVKAYDLANEPSVPVGEQDVWLAAAAQCVAAIREVDPSTPILIEAAQGANPSGFPTLRPIAGNNLVYGVHLYYPHAFTHQRQNGAAEFGSPETSPFKFYPGWMPQINWRDEGWLSEPYEWWDRWEIAAASLPVFEFLIRYRRPLDVGEFGVTGYVRDAAGPCATWWTGDAIDLARRWGASWDLYGYHGGFGWYEGVPDLVTSYWMFADGPFREQ